MALAGSVDASVRLLDRVTTAGESRGPCRIFGTNRYAAPQEAALINGMAGHAIDFDLANTVFAGHALVADEIKRIDVSLMIDHVYYVDRPNPRDGLDAKFSTQYCLARTLLQGRPRIADFEGDAFLDEKVRGLMTRIHVSSPAHITTDTPRTLQGGANLRVTTLDGRTFSGSAEKAKGRDGNKLLTAPILEGKFVDCAKQVLPTESVDRLVGIVRDIDSAPSMREVSAMMVATSG